MFHDYDLSEFLTRYDLNYNTVGWTIFFFVGFIACMLHTQKTYLRWKTVRETEDQRTLDAASWWFLRQDIGGDLQGFFMFLGGFLAFIRTETQWVVICLVIGAFFFMMNKLWNLYDDKLITDAIRDYLKEKHEQLNR